MTVCYFAAETGNCDAPPKFDNAMITTPFRTVYLSYSEVVYGCRSKYLIVGENRLQCQDGEWETKNITCARMYISKLHIPFKQR